MRNSNIDKPIYDGKTTKELLADRETYEQLLDDYKLSHNGIYKRIFEFYKNSYN